MYLHLNLNYANLNQLKCHFGVQSLYMSYGNSVIYHMGSVINNSDHVFNALSTENSRKKVFNLQHYFRSWYWLCLWCYF